MDFIVRIAKKPLLIVLFILGVSIVLISSIAQNASLETDLDEYMPATHPAFVFSDQAEEMFSIKDSVLIAIEHPDTIFNAGTLEKIKTITEELPELFPEIYAGGITSLYTADNITGTDGDLEVEPFYEEIPRTTEELLALQLSVESNDMVYGRNVSLDSKATLILAEIDPEADATDLHVRLEAYAASFEGPETLYVAGRPIVEGAMAELGPADMARMVPIVMVVMIILLLLLLRSIRDTVINLVIVLFGTIVPFGAMAVLGVPIYAVDTMIPVMLIAIGVAYGIHMHNSIHHSVQTNPGISKQELVKDVLTAMIRPVSMAAITTAIGFMSLMTSQVLPVRYFGLFASVGVMTEMALALILFPASIYLFGPPKIAPKRLTGGSGSGNGSKQDGAWGAAMMRRPLRVVAIAAIVIVLGILGTTNVWIDTSFLANFEKESDIVITDNFVNTRFGGTSSLNVVLSTDNPDTFKNPEVLKAMYALQTDVENHALVGTSFSISDFIKRMNTVMFDNDPAYDTIPDDQDLIAQYLLLYEFSGDPETLAKVVDYDYQNANITFQLKSDSSAVMSEVIDMVAVHEATMTELGVTLRYAGSGYKAFVFAELLLEGQIISIVLSFLIVALLLALLFKNLLIGIVGTIPIAITAVVNFGVMGLLNIPLSSATALISSIAVGIGVDYAIHLIEHYRNRRLEDVSIHDAAFETLAHTGRAIIYNAVAVMGGFAVLMFSVFPPNRQVGGLIVLNMATSAIGTLSILLVAIVALDKKGKFIRIKSTSGSKEKIS
ncbi:MAG: RND family transporter [Sphaerochaetaceae bacterium]